MVTNDGIYLYDSVTETTTKQIDLLDITVSNIEILADDNVVFVDNTYSERTTGDSRSSAFDGMLYQFSPRNGELLELGSPKEPWP